MFRSWCPIPREVRHPPTRRRTPGGGSGSHASDRGHGGAQHPGMPGWDKPILRCDAPRTSPMSMPTPSACAARPRPLQSDPCADPHNPERALGQPADRPALSPAGRCILVDVVQSGLDGSDAIAILGARSTALGVELLHALVDLLALRHELRRHSMRSAPASPQHFRARRVQGPASLFDTSLVVGSTGCASSSRSKWRSRV
jgi:hypothetical protein